MRRSLVCGNWKMHKTVAESLALVRELRQRIPETSSVEVGFAPPFTALAPVRQALAGSHLQLCAQNVAFEKQGAFTGEVSAAMLADVGCAWAIVGHSERRQLFGETDATVSRRTRQAIEQGLIPLICVGETLAEREASQTLAVVSRQVDAALEGLAPDVVARCVIAYEPVWAIGTGKVATPVQAQEVHLHIRDQVARRAGRKAADQLRIIYGGSVKADNAAAVLGQPDVDGALVGGASLVADDFARIVAAAR